MAPGYFAGDVSLNGTGDDLSHSDADQVGDDDSVSFSSSFHCKLQQ